MPRALNPNLAKLHRNYTVEEIAALFGVHKNTVRSWIKAGLPVCDSRRPVLVLGRSLREFLQKRRAAHNRRCGVHELYCLRCREPRWPAEGMVDFEPLTPTTGRVTALCPVCTAMMNRYVSREALGRIRADLDVRMPTAQQHISESNKALLNSDFD